MRHNADAFWCNSKWTWLAPLQGQRGRWTLKQQHKDTYQQLHENSAVTQSLSVYVRTPTAALAALRDAVGVWMHGALVPQAVGVGEGACLHADVCVTDVMIRWPWLRSHFLLSLCGDCQINYQKAFATVDSFPKYTRGKLSHQCLEIQQHGHPETSWNNYHWGKGCTYQANGAE